MLHINYSVGFRMNTELFELPSWSGAQTHSNSLGMGTRRPGTSRGLAEESRDNTKVPRLFVHYSAMHKHRSLNYLNLAMISESLTL